MTEEDGLALDRGIELELETIITEGFIDKQRSILVSIDSGVVVIYGAMLPKMRMSLPLTEEKASYVQIEICRQLMAKGYNCSINDQSKSRN